MWKFGLEFCQRQQLETTGASAGVACEASREGTSYNCERLQHVPERPFNTPLCLSWKEEHVRVCAMRPPACCHAAVAALLLVAAPAPILSAFGNHPPLHCLY